MKFALIALAVLALSPSARACGEGEVEVDGQCFRALPETQLRGVPQRPAPTQRRLGMEVSTRRSQRGQTPGNIQPNVSAAPPHIDNGEVLIKPEVEDYGSSGSTGFQQGATGQ